MVIDDQSTYVNSIGRQNRDQSNLKSKKNCLKMSRRSVIFLKNKIDSNNKRGSQTFWPRLKTS